MSNIDRSRNFNHMTLRFANEKEKVSKLSAVYYTMTVNSVEVRKNKMEP